MIITVCICAILSFSYGVLTIQYRLFPFKQLKVIKQIANPSLSRSDYFYHKKSFFEQHQTNKYDLVFIGDSLTDSAEWEDLFPSLKIANRGINGDNTSGVLERMEGIYSTSAKRAFVMLGSNDFSLGHSVNYVFENYKCIVDKLIDQGMKVYIQSTILAGRQKKELNININELNRRLKVLTTQSNALVYIDLNANLTKDSLLQNAYSRDGIHLNGDGYAVWRNILIPYVRQ